MIAILPPTAPARLLELAIDGVELGALEGSTIIYTCRSHAKQTPTLCFLDTLHPVNVCRICVVAVEGSRVLVPSCARKVEPGMKVRTDSERVRHSRKMVLEFLDSSVDLSTTPDVADWKTAYGCDSERYGPPALPAPAAERDHAHAGHHEPPDPDHRATVAQPVKIDNSLYVRAYAKCILCYKCVEACGTDFQNSFAIGVAGRGLAG